MPSSRLALIVTGEEADHILDVAIDARGAAGLVEAIAGVQNMLIPGEILSTIITALGPVELSDPKVFMVPPSSGSPSGTMPLLSESGQEALNGTLSD